GALLLPERRVDRRVGDPLPAVDRPRGAAGSHGGSSPLAQGVATDGGQSGLCPLGQDRAGDLSPPSSPLRPAGSSRPGGDGLSGECPRSGGCRSGPQCLLGRGRRPLHVYAGGTPPVLYRRSPPRGPLPPPGAMLLAVLHPDGCLRAC